MWRHILWVGLCLVGQGLGFNGLFLGAVFHTFWLQIATIYVPPLNPVFKTQPLTLVELFICLGAVAARGAAGHA